MISEDRPWPLELTVHRKTAILDVVFDDGRTFSLPARVLRTMTPSAAERGHGSPRNHPLEADYSGVGLLGAQPVGAYAVRLLFDDGHDTGLYTWEALYQLGQDKDRLLDELESRRPR